METASCRKAARVAESSDSLRLWSDTDASQTGSPPKASFQRFTVRPSLASSFVGLM